MEFNTEFSPRYGEAVPVAEGVSRITVNNPGPFTFHGTNTYLVGTNEVAVIDPGPDNSDHLNAILKAVDGRPVSHIIVSHTHADHSPLAKRLKEATGANTFAEGAHRPARPLRIGEINPLDASADTDFVPDVILGDGEIIEGDGWSLETIHTPGHTANHAAFGWRDRGILFSADHVMGWSTSIVAPPDGAMADYMTSLKRLMEYDYRTYLPGHGGRIEKPSNFLRGLRTHRLMRERAILKRIEQGDRLISDMVGKIYADIDPRLHGAAALSVLAHIEDLVGRGEVTAESEIAIDGTYRISG